MTKINKYYICKGRNDYQEHFLG